MRQSLFSLPPVVRLSVLWCRPCFGSAGRPPGRVEYQQFAIGLFTPLPLGVASWLRQNCQVLSVQALPSNSVAVQVRVSGPLSHVLHTLPKPTGGSRHESNLLLW